MGIHDERIASLKTRVELTREEIEWLQSDEMEVTINGKRVNEDWITKGEADIKRFEDMIKGWKSVV